jgi:hypothetical protein
MLGMTRGWARRFGNRIAAPKCWRIVFTTEGIENIPAGWRARETYKILGADEFVEVFELAKPGKDFELYSEGHYRRKE